MTSDVLAQYKPTVAQLRDNLALGDTEAYDSVLTQLLDSAYDWALDYCKLTIADLALDILPPAAFRQAVLIAASQLFKNREGESTAAAAPLAAAQLLGRYKRRAAMTPLAEAEAQRDAAELTRRVAEDGRREAEAGRAEAEAQREAAFAQAADSIANSALRWKYVTDINPDVENFDNKADSFFASPEGLDLAAGLRAILSGEGRAPLIGEIVDFKCMAQQNKADTVCFDRNGGVVTFSGIEKTGINMGGEALPRRASVDVSFDDKVGVHLSLEEDTGDISVIVRRSVDKELYTYALRVHHQYTYTTDPDEESGNTLPVAIADIVKIPNLPAKLGDTVIFSDTNDAPFTINYNSTTYRVLATVDEFYTLARKKKAGLGTSAHWLIPGVPVAEVDSAGNIGETVTATLEVYSTVNYLTDEVKCVWAIESLT